MRITTIGRGTLGGGLAKLWRAAGHEVSELGRGGGDATDADAVLVAVPGAAVSEALASVDGLAGKTVLDASNHLGATRPPDGFESNAAYVKSITGGPTAKAFNANYGVLLDRVAAASPPPGNIWCGDEEARETTEALCRDAGYEPIHAGPLTNAPMLEQCLPFLFAIAKDGGMGPYFYRFAPPDRF